MSLIAGAALIFACNPEENQPGGNGGNGGGGNGGGNGGGTKSNERTLLSIAFDHQIGDAVITPEGDDAGTVEFQLAVDLISDLSQVEITTLTFSYGATCTAKKGDKIDFTASNPSITVTAESGKTRTYSLAMTPFSESFAGCYSITGSQILGGLGDATDKEVWSWGVLLLASPEEKSWCWAKWAALGYGPAANYDNYLEVKCTKINDDGTTEGTCINYGGADGKHWNCLLDGAQNKVKAGQDMDLHHFYRVIPIGESTWKKDYAAGTITFKDAEGNERVGMLFDTDIEICKDANKVVTVTDLCLAFTVDGDTTWNSENQDFLAPMLYTDFLKFVIAPRYYFMHIKKVDSIPAESKVVGDEGDITIEDLPDDPNTNPDPGTETEFTLADVPGDYMVEALKINGGGRSGFDEIKLKPWDWTGFDENAGTSNANREYDNTLTITMNGTSGTLNYGPGADGLFWDYVYINNMNGNKNDYGDITVDCSNNFGQLPQGESTFVLDTEQMVVAITAGGKTTYGMIFGPGKQTYGSLSLTIPSGCIAVAFQLKEYEGTEYTYEDRFSSSDLNMIVFHPVVYVMIFKKQ